MYKNIFIMSQLLASTALFAGEVPALETSKTDVSIASAPQPSIDTERKALNEKEKRAASLAKQWIEAKSMPVREEDGKIVYQYGATLPTVICSPLHICDIELQAGELITEHFVGDKPRWKTVPSVSGTGTNRTPHIMIKPTEAGISTTIVITTNLRTYHIKLVSQNKNWMPRVGFSYSSDIEREWQQYYAREGEKKDKATIPETKENIDSLDFEYDIDGSASWKPVRVYNDGVKTIIQMPKSMAQTEAPALLVMGPEGNQIVNYRLKNDRYIVDQIFGKAILIAGVGSSQTKVVISYKKSKSL